MHSKALINKNLSEALGLLDINEVRLRHDLDQKTQDEKMTVVSPREHAQALFTYLNMAGYLNGPLLKKAVDYLAAAKPFARNKITVLRDLTNACNGANQDGQFDVNFFMTNFAKQTYFTVDDVIDLIVFLQQTAFDRQYGVERDRLKVKPWMEVAEQKKTFKEYATKLGVITPLPPLQDQYLAAGIMGAASPRVKKRLAYFQELKIKCDHVWALSGNRELSKGLDEESVMEAVAKHLEKPLNYVDKKVGADTRQFLDGITETMMVNYLIQTTYPEMNINVVDSAVESGHWRATSAQNAIDIAPIVVKKIKSQEIKNTEDGRYHFLIIAEQPYAGRMARQVQREFNKEIKKSGLKIVIEVEGCGPGISEKELSDQSVLTRINSELGALMAERFNDARLLLQQSKPGLSLRDPNFILFSKRDDTFKAYEAKAEHVVRRGPCVLL